MKKLKKIFAVMLALALVAALCIPAVAEGNGVLRNIQNYKITLKDCEPGAQYNVYAVIKQEQGGNLFKLGYWPSGIGQWSEYTGDSKQKVNEKLQKIAVETNEGTTEKLFQDVVENGEINFTKFALALDNIVIKNDNVSANNNTISAAFLPSEAANEIYKIMRREVSVNDGNVYCHNPIASGNADENGNFTFTHSEHMYYLVTKGDNKAKYGSTNDSGDNTSDEFVCIFRLIAGDGTGLPSDENSGKDEEIDVPIPQPKKDTPEIHKTIGTDTANRIDSTGADVGSQVTFTLDGTAPGLDKADYYRYSMVDTLSTGLKFDEATVAVTAKDGDGEAVTLEKGTDYSITVYGQTVTFKFGPDDLGLKGVDKLAGMSAPHIVVTYKATLGPEAFTTDAETNEVSLNYNNGGGDKSTPGEKVNVYDFTLDITKHADSEDGSVLAGAEFALVKPGEAEGSYKAYKRTDVGVTWVDISLENGKTLLDALNSMKDDITTVTTSVEGKAAFNGLDSGTYQLVELTAPDGYNRLEQPQEVTFRANLAAEEDETLNTTAPVSIVNKKGSELPSTGGMGTTLFYAGGAVLVVGAGVILFKKRNVMG